MNSNDDILRWKLRALRQDMTPSHDLWPGIAARVAAGRAGEAPGVRQRKRWVPLAMAASMLLAGGLAWQVQAPAPVASANSPEVQREAEALVRQYRGALEEVARLPQAQAAESYSPGLRELDSSAELIIGALQRDPDSRLLLDQLRRTYSKRLAIAQRTTTFS